MQILSLSMTSDWLDELVVMVPYIITLMPHVFILSASPSLSVSALLTSPVLLCWTTMPV
jgi:hypothetical protein